MRILHIASGDTWGGAESQLCGLIAALGKISGVETSVIVLNQGLLATRLDALGTDYWVIDESKHSTFKLFRALKKRIDTLDPDLIHTHGYKQNIIGSIASYFSRQKICVRTQHGDWEIAMRWFSPNRIFRRLDLIAARYLQHGIVAVSNELALSLKQSMSPEKVTTIENGIDVESIAQSKTARTTATSQCSYSVAFVGRMVDVKRVDLFLHAARMTIERFNRPINFNVYGDGPRLIEFQNVSRQLGTEDHVTFHGFVEQIDDQLAASDLLVMTSDHEGLPMVLLEAMYLGVPVVAPSVGGIPAVLSRQYGELVSEQSATAYSDAILSCISRNAELRRNIASAKPLIEKDYSTATQALKYQRFYQHLLKTA